MRALLLCSFLLVTACGFRPVYEQHSGRLDTSDVVHGLSVITPEGWEGDRLKSAIEDEFQISGNPDPRYRLVAGLNVVSEPFIIEPDGLASRYTMRLSSPWQLYRASDNKLLKDGMIRRDVSYNVSENADYATFVSQEDAIQRGIQEIAGLYGMQIPALLAAAISRTQ
jgi:hypothetical protein